MKRTDLKQIIAQELEVELEILHPDLELSKIENYDSVSVLSLMLALDEKAGIKMTPADTRGLRVYGDIERLAEKQGIALTD